MQWLSNSAYTICDRSLDELIRSGRSNDSKYQKIKKAETLRQLEMFFRQNNTLGFVYQSGDKVLWHNRLPFDAKRIIPMAKEYNQVVQLNLSGDYYSEYHFSFDPWHWHIVLIKKTSHFAPLINRVNKAYIATSGILLVSLLFIFFIIKISIKNPICKIIAPLKKNQKPCIRGTVEFEFLSKSIEKMMTSLHLAKQDLEERVEARTEELRQTNDALRAAKEKLSRQARELKKQVTIRTSEITGILKYTPAVVYMKNVNGKYLLVNPRYEELFKIKNEDVRGKTDMEFMPADVAAQFMQHDERVLSEGRALNVESQIKQENGIHTYLSVKFPIFAESGEIRGVCGIGSDITELKKAYEKLHRLSSSILSNQEKERTAIARELHDELGQALTALNMDAFWLQEQIKKAGIPGVEKVISMRTLIENTIKSVQHLAVQLRPGILDDMGLVDALEWYIEEFQRRVQIRCKFKANTIPRLDETLSTSAYRIAQEALTNVARHANATRVEIFLKKTAENLELTIRDDGRGFMASAASEGEELGLAGMRERATLAGGSLLIDSTPGYGTRICFRVPMGDEPIGAHLIQ
jgi:PAS domain S-box-containing protein